MERSEILENENHINLEQTNTKAYQFHKLTPISDVKNEIYVEALNFVFQEADLKNIAITGPYSSGKSSMLETYKSKNQDKKFIHVSLAHFLNNNSILEDDKDCSNQSGIDETKIEGKILNQLIHQINPNYIPQTQFNVKKQFSKKLACLCVLAFTLFFILLIFLFTKGTWYNYVDSINTRPLKWLFAFTTKDWFVSVALFLCITIFMIGLYNGILIQYNKKLFRKFSIQGNDIELFEENNDSIFDKYLNEVLYLFQNINADVFVFEDMDRYNSNIIFEKLREINYLLNNGYKNNVDDSNQNIFSRTQNKIRKMTDLLKNKGKNRSKDSKISEQKIYRFFYMLRDDIFETKDRVKFFDFIIPIVPIINGANSFNKFLKNFDDGGIIDYFDRSFLKEISFYVDDMRLLKNICNEYLVYQNQIQSATELMCDKLLSMIIYKNLFPRDFSELQIRKGYVYCLFKNKDKYISESIETLVLDIEKTKKEIECVKNEQINSVAELDAIYINTDVLRYSIEGKPISSFPSSIEFLKAIKDNEYRVTDNYRTRSAKQEFDNLLNNKNYKKRLVNIENKSVNTLNDLSEKLEKLGKQYKNMMNPHLKEIIESKPDLSEIIFAAIYTDENGFEYKYSDVKGSIYFPLIKYLIRNGYIAEDYPDYMSYFYEESLKCEDQIFIRSILDAKAKSFDYKLKNVNLVEQNLHDRRFFQPEVLNFDLFEYLIDKQSPKLSNVLSLIINESKTDFLIQYWKSDRNKEKFIQVINNAWPEFWDVLVTNQLISEMEGNQYLIDTFYYSPTCDIERMNTNNKIKNYVSRKKNFLAVEGPKTHLIADCLELLGVQFRSLNYDKSDKELFDEIYNRNLYEINKEMIFLLLRIKYSIEENDDFYHRNYALIKSMPDEPLYMYVSENLRLYLGEVFLFCQGEITDNEEDVISILNDENIDIDIKEHYIDFLATKISDIESINETDMWPVLYDNRKVLCTGKNIVNFYIHSKAKFSTILSKFINDSIIEIDSLDEVVKGIFDKNLIESFIFAIVSNNNLKLDKYKMLLSSFGTTYDVFKVVELDNDKFEILVELDFIEMNEENLLFVRVNYTSCLKQYIIRGLDLYVNSVINSKTFSLSELRLLLTTQIEETYVEKLLSYTKQPVSIKDLMVADNIKMMILSEHYDDNDMLYFINHFEEESSEVQGLLINLWSLDSIEFDKQDIMLPSVILHRLLQHPSVVNKESMFLRQMFKLPLDDIIICLNLLNKRAILEVFKGVEQGLAITEEHKQILEMMKERGWISSFSEAGIEGEFYNVVPNKILVDKTIELC